MGSLWKMDGLRKEIDFEEEDVCWFVGMVGFH